MSAGPGRAAFAGPGVAAVMLIAGLIGTHAAGVRFRDPDHVAAGYVAMACTAFALLVGLDVWIRTGRLRPSLARWTAVRRRRWTRGRLAVCAGGLLSFYASYLAYRNLKAIVPLLEPHRSADAALDRADRLVFGGHAPAQLLHDALGRGVSAHVLSDAYVAFIVFLPLSLVLALVFAPALRASVLLSTAQGLNWMLGAASYFLLPALGPVYYAPGRFAALPHTEVTHLQSMLLGQRLRYLAHPDTATPQAIAAFASLHVSMSLTALLVARRLGAPLVVRRSLLAWLAVTVVATVYLGWHYVADDVAGLAFGGAAYLAAERLIGGRLVGATAGRGRRRRGRRPSG